MPPDKLPPDHVDDRDEVPHAPDGPSAAALLALGVANACCLAAGLALGWFVDDLLDTSPAFTLVGIASGIVLGIIGTVVQMRRFLRD